MIMLENYNFVSVEPFFRKKKINDEDKIFDMMEKYATNSTMKTKNQKVEKNKDKFKNHNQEKNKNSQIVINSHINSKNKPPKSEKQIQNDIKKIGQVLNAKELRKDINTGNENKNKVDNHPNDILKEKKNDKLNLNKPAPETNSNKILKKEKPAPINLKLSEKIQTSTPQNLPKIQNNNILQINSSDHLPPLNNLQSESIEMALPEINISNNRKIENFFPYFLKTNLISLNNQNVQMRQNYNPFNHYLEYKDLRNLGVSEHIISGCMDPLCELCDINSKITCFQCQPGHFLLEGKCYNSCPVNFNADIYRRECVSLTVRQRNTFSRTTYLKAFSAGSCKNMCGKITADCSCQQDCTQYGNCCSDYRDCEILVRNNMNKTQECEKLNPDCELCLDIDSQSNKCGQCKPGFFLRDGQCVKFCEIDDKALIENMVCYKSQKCLVDNCLECENGNPSVCQKCFNGFFLHNNMCHVFCPGTLRADRMNWICMEQSVFAWYWIFPSKNSCRNRCDSNMGVDGMDCSCREDCIKYGNCCQDVEDFCYKFIIN